MQRFYLVPDSERNLFGSGEIYRRRLAHERSSAGIVARPNIRLTLYVLYLSNGKCIGYGLRHYKCGKFSTFDSINVTRPAKPVLSLAPKKLFPSYYGRNLVLTFSI